MAGWAVFAAINPPFGLLPQGDLRARRSGPYAACFRTRPDAGSPSEVGMVRSGDGVGSRVRLIQRAAIGAIVVTLIAGVLPGLPSFLGGAEPAAAATSVSFSYTGAAQSWQVPTGVTSIQVDAYGAAGGIDAAGLTTGGLAGRTSAVIPVTPGESLQ